MKKQKVDYFGKNAELLKNKKLFLFDMDGTIYNEDSIFNGTLDLLTEIKMNGGRYVFITNNSSKSVNDYVNKVTRLGIEADVENFFTSAQATVLYLKEKFPEGLVYCQGTKSLIRGLKESGIRVTESVTDEAEVVLVGFDTELTTEKVYHTCEMLQKNIPFLATNPDLACPVSFGFVPDCGSICKMFEDATGKRPIYIGKPEAMMVNIVREKFHCCAEETVVIGDRLYTDIATGLNAGVDAICVLTGEATVQDIIGGKIKPTYTFKSVKEIYKALQKEKVGYFQEGVI